MGYGDEVSPPMMYGPSMVTLGSPITLYCNVSASSNDQTIRLEWRYPAKEEQEDGNETDGIKKRIRTVEYNNGMSFTRLIVSNVTSGDNGSYYCRAITTSSKIETVHNVTVLEKQVKLTSKNATGSVSLGGNITWVVELEVDAEAEPKLVFKRNEMELTPGDKYTIEKDWKEKKVASIQIKNIRENDYGRYDFEAITGLHRRTISFELRKVKSASIAGALGASGITAISAAAISVVALIAGSISYYRFRKEKARNIALSNEETERFLKGQPESLNPAMGLSEQAHLLPFDEQWDFPPDKLKLGDLAMIVEYCPFGSLDKFLRANKDGFVNQIDPHTKIINDNIRKQQLPTEDSSSKEAAIEAKREGTQGVKESRNPPPAENAVRKSTEGSDLARRFTTSNLASWAYQIAQGMEYLVSRKLYQEMNKPYQEKNAEYFQTKTDYLQMIPVKSDDGYMRPLRSQDAYGEKYNITVTHKYVNSEISEPKVYYLPMTASKVQVDLQEKYESQVKNEIPGAHGVVTEDPTFRNEQHRATGSESRFVGRLNAIVEDLSLEPERERGCDETAPDHTAAVLEPVAPEVGRPLRVGMLIKTDS
ncbi:unnamed protein product [Darwinula stevensoni]|uniref:Ig-like domain-containing protein n=1 Tax=Darwinula stevensoni TaxID=69355 RepID=A0A7R9ABH4_9CRUS|nr:unnamed protein product [Darwinula stevensoni]CAG0899428.1 unnamed protein product [Darwinula stevensoni]